MGLYGCRSGVDCTKLPLFCSPVSCSECSVDLVEDKGDQSSTSAEPIGNICANYSFCASIYVVKMLSKCEPRESTSLTTPMPTIFSAPQFVWSRWCRAANHLTLTPKPSRVANCSLQLPRQTFFTERSLSSHGTLLGSGWKTPAESIRRKGLSAQAGRAICLPNLFHR